MKYIFLSFLFAMTYCFSFASQTDTLKVNGMCGDCKAHIEKAAKAAGATVANWNMKTKLLVVNYNTDKTSSLKIEQSIAQAGYDTPDVKASSEAYNNLDECCQYPRTASKD